MRKRKRGEKDRGRKVGKEKKGGERGTEKRTPKKKKKEEEEADGKKQAHKGAPSPRAHATTTRNKIGSEYE